MVTHLSAPMFSEPASLFLLPPLARPIAGRGVKVEPRVGVVGIEEDGLSPAETSLNRAGGTRPMILSTKSSISC